VTTAARPDNQVLKQLDTQGRITHNAFAIAERAVETARALKTLGFDKREVTSAMDRTRTHVGTSELTLQQWITIALSYCPKPISR
jgi:Holliday junction resolvasome RuvABC DNA-binding subunit